MPRKKRTSKRTITALGKTIQADRIARGWSVATLAAKAGVDEGTVQNAEDNGEAYVEKLTKIAHALGYAALKDLISPPKLDAYRLVVTAQLLSAENVENHKGLDPHHLREMTETFAFWHGKDRARPKLTQPIRERDGHMLG